MRLCPFISGSVVFALSMILGSAAVGDDRAEARKVIDKAIQAVGGQSNLAKYPAATWKGHVTDFSQGVPLKYTAEFAYQAPAQYRMAAELQGVFALVISGNQGWLASGGITRPMGREELTEHHEELYAFGLARLLLFKNPALRLSLTGDDKVGERPVVGVKVTCQGRRDVVLYFDKETGLLAKLGRRVKAFEQGGKDVLHETYFADYKEVNGVKLACKITEKRGGQSYRETEIDDTKLLEKVDNGVFAKP